MTTDQVVSTSEVARVGSRRFDRLLIPIVGVFGLFYVAQCADSFIAEWPSMAGAGGIALYAILGLSVLIGLVAAVVSARVGRILLFASFYCYLVALVLWPFVIVAAMPTETVPWPLAVWGFYAACLIVVEPHPVLPLLVSAIIGADIGFVSWSVGGIDAVDAALNGAQVVALTTAMWTLLFLVRRAVAAADRAQQAALERYAATRLHTATEHERVRTDALVNDSVLTTFLSAAAARTDEAEELAGRMARNALRILSRVEKADAAGDLVAFGRALTALKAERAALIDHFEQDVDPEALSLVVPEPAAAALIAAMVEAMENSLRHAGDCHVRSLRVAPLGYDGLRVIVTDDGAGFDAGLPRTSGGAASAITRVHAVEGFARIDSEPGHGTAFVLAWGSSVTPDGAFDPSGEGVLTA